MTVAFGRHRLGCVLLCLVGVIHASQLSAEDTPKAAPPKNLLLEWGQQGSEQGQFHFPIGIALTKAGDVVVSDFYNDRIQRFNSDGKFLAEFAVLPNPGGIALDGDGNLYITHFPAMKKDEEKKPDRVSVYNLDGKLLREWGTSGTGNGEFDYPGGVAVSPAGRVYVADQTNRRVQVFDRDGRFLLKWGEYGVKEGQFGGNINPKSRVGGPQFLTLDGDGNVYTTEGSLGRIQVFTADGKFIRAWGNKDDKPGGFGGTWSKGALGGPVAICFDQHGNLWISAVSGRIQQFTKEGVFLQTISHEQGSDPGQFLAPHGLVADSRGNLFVVDSFNHRIQKFAIGP